MSVKIDASLATFNVRTTGAVPALAFDTTHGFARGHLTEGFNGSDWTGDAVFCDASVPVSGPAKETDQLELGFVQLARATQFQAFYAGRIPSEGGISLDYFLPPALKQTILLDGVRSAPDPWYRRPAFGLAAGGRRTASISDHPGMVVRLGLENRSRSNVRTFLFHAIMDREFWSILTAVERGAEPRYLAYFQWQVRYDFRVNWVNGAPVAGVSGSFVKVVNAKKIGRPPEAELQALLNAPRGDRANGLGAMAAIITESGNPPNRRDSTSRFLNVPPNFWS